MRRFAGILLLGALLVGCGGGSEDGKIAFHSNRDGDGEIFVMNADGTGVQQLTDNNDSDYSPAWSPNSNKIVFQSDRDGDFEIFVMNADGTGVQQLTDNNDSEYFPAWSPNSNKIAFQSDRDGDDEIFVMNADGTGVTQLTDNDDGDYSPAWSPSGKKIAFVSDRDGDFEIFVMSADGTGVEQLTDNDVDDFQPNWSSSRIEIVFASDRSGDSEIFVMGGDWYARLESIKAETGETFENESGISRINASWNIEQDRDRKRAETIVNDLQQQRTDNDDNDQTPVWSPSGKKIAFSSDRYGDSEIFVMNADGSNVVSLGQQGIPWSWGG